MIKRPICLACLILILGIIFWISHQKPNIREYDGEKKTITCHVDSINGIAKHISILASNIRDSKGELCKRLKIYFKENEKDLLNIKVGNQIQLKGKLYSYPRATNPGQFDIKKYYSQQEIYYYFYADSISISDSSYDFLKEKIYESKSYLINKIFEILPKKEAGTIVAMLFGEKDFLDEEIKDLYKNLGIGHILAISGLHISFIGMGLFYVLRRFFFHMKISALLTILILILYGILVGFPVSACRAIIMMSCMLLARFLGKRYDFYCALSLSAITQILITPQVIYQTGFLLSYGTVLGISLFVSSLANKNGKKRIKYLIIESLKGSFGIFLVNLPILSYSYYSFSPYSFLINALILPFLCIIVFSAFMATISSLFFIYIAKFISGITYYLFAYYEIICSFFVELPFAEIVVGRPNIIRIIIYYLLMLVYILYNNLYKARKKRKVLFGLFSLLLLLILLFNPQIDDKVYIYNLDIGQGDCQVIFYKEKTILIDCGSSDEKNISRDKLIPFLKFMGRNKLDYVFLTHSDNDHINGIVEILDQKRKMGLEINNFVLPYIENKSDAYKKLEKTIVNNNKNVFYMDKGKRININDLSLSCIHPYKSYKYEDENDYSLTLMLEYKNFKALFTGDLGFKGEKEIINDIGQIDFLKVGHHGSKNSSSNEFLSKLKPKFAIISAGKKNRYGHPSKESLKRLKNVGAKIFITINSGAIITETDGEKAIVNEFVKSD